MINRAILNARGAQLCHCKHELKWHAPCSKCFCPEFLPPGADAEARQAWKRGHRARSLAERAR